MAYMSGKIGFSYYQRDLLYLNKALFAVLNWPSTATEDREGVNQVEYYDNMDWLRRWTCCYSLEGGFYGFL